MPLDLYSFPPSPPCRSVLLVVRALGLDVNVKNVNILEGEHLTVEYIQMNPQHTIPTMDDDGFILWESRAIMGYLVDQYGTDDSLFPKQPKERALVNARLYFDAGTLYQRLAEYFIPVLFRGEKPNPDLWKRVEEAFGFLDKFLEGNKWVAGDKITIADYSIAVTTSNAEAFGLSVDDFSQVSRWYNNAKNSIDGFEEINQSGANTMRDMFHARTSADS
ncbi:glutathione S-transferase 1-1 [Anabrus simplex]|uniref:glutathione S-transferase 1-1 n=1 Tax=Anabrus simplex TaxID=316456 RepID=UPI0035A27ABE